MLWDRPCRFHKESGVECSQCPHYQPRGENILIIKLDAMGDVLRTTCILQGLKKLYPQGFITWITRPVSKELLQNNPYIDWVLTKDLDIQCMLQQEKFDLVLNPDASPASALIAVCATGKRKLGFGYKNNKVVPLNQEAEYWYLLGMDDNLKKANTRTYQSIILEMLKIPGEQFDIIVNLTPEEIAFARRFSEENKITKDKPVIGLNLDAGKRWQMKSWPLEYTVELAQLIDKRIRGQVILYGGPEERERNKSIVDRSKVPIIDAGTGNSVREFIALVNLCDILVASDSLALHIGVGLGKKVAALFGPTSSAEIELYGKGAKIVTPLPCRCCYRRCCNEKPNCMEAIKPQQVIACIEKLL